MILPFIGSHPSAIACKNRREDLEKPGQNKNDYFSNIWLAFRDART
jgi:hypothetical protein